MTIASYLDFLDPEKWELEKDVLRQSKDKTALTLASSLAKDKAALQMQDDPFAGYDAAMAGQGTPQGAAAAMHAFFKGMQGGIKGAKAQRAAATLQQLEEYTQATTRELQKKMKEKEAGEKTLPFLEDYYKSADKLSPEQRNDYISKNIIDSYNNITGENWSLQSIDGADPAKVTVVDRASGMAMPIDLKDSPMFAGITRQRNQEKLRQLVMQNEQEKLRQGRAELDYKNRYLGHLEKSHLGNLEVKLMNAGAAAERVKVAQDRFYAEKVAPIEKKLDLTGISMKNIDILEQITQDPKNRDLYKDAFANMYSRLGDTQDFMSGVKRNIAKIGIRDEKKLAAIDTAAKAMNDYALTEMALRDLPGSAWRTKFLQEKEFKTVANLFMHPDAAKEVLKGMRDRTRTHEFGLNRSLVNLGREYRGIPAAVEQGASATGGAQTPSYATLEGGTGGNVGATAGGGMVRVQDPSTGATREVSADKVEAIKQKYPHLQVLQ